MVEQNEIASRLQLAALDASNVGTWELDIAEDRFRCDELAGILYGLSVEEGMVGVPFGRAVAMIHPDDLAMWRARRQLSLRHGGLFVIEYRIVSEPGKTRWVLVRGRYDVGPDGGVQRASGIVIDLTDSKRDGFAEGQASFVDSPAENGALERAAIHALAAHRALSRLGGVVQPSLLIAADALLQEIGLVVAKAQSAVEGRSSLH